MGFCESDQPAVLHFISQCRHTRIAIHINIRRECTIGDPIQRVVRSRPKSYFRLPASSLGLVYAVVFATSPEKPDSPYMANLTPTAAIVDDEESVGRAIRRLLKSAGIEAEVFTSGDGFLDRLSSDSTYRPDCVILDVLMPGISGLEVQRRLAGRGLPIIIMTAHDDVTVRAQVLAAGAIDYLRKPFDAAALIRAVQSAMGVPPVP